MNRAIFLDRDGVINRLPPKFPNDGIGDIRNYVTMWQDFHYMPGVIEAFKLIKETNYKAVIISNQGGAIGRELVNYDTIEKLFITLSMDIYNQTGVHIKYYFCRHRWDELCGCCKPTPGMLYAAAYDLDICLGESHIIGDSPGDMYAGYNAGITKREQLHKVGGIAKYSDVERDNPAEYFAHYIVPILIPTFHDSMLDTVKSIIEMDA